MKLRKKLTVFWSELYRFTAALVMAVSAALALFMLCQRYPLILSSQANPFLLTAIFLGFFVGFKGAFLTGIILGATYFWLFKELQDLEAIESIYSIEYLILPVATIIVPSVIGALSDRFKQQTKFLNQRLDEFRKAVENIGSLNQKLQNEKNLIERRVATRVLSASRFFEIAQTLESTNIVEVCDALVELVCEQLEIENCHLYVLEKDVLTNISKQDKAGHNMPDKIKVPADLSNYPLILEAMTKRVLIRSEDIAGKEDNSVMKHGAVAPLLSLSQKVLGLIVVRRIEFLNYLPITFSNLKAIGEWGGLILWRLQRVNQQQESQFKDEISGLPNYSYFKRRIRGDCIESKRFKIPLVLLKISFPHFLKSNPMERALLLQILGKRFNESRRDEDEITLGSTEGEFFYITRYKDKSFLEQTMASISDAIDEAKQLTGKNLLFEENTEVFEMDEEENTIESFLFERNIY